LPPAAYSPEGDVHRKREAATSRIVVVTSSFRVRR
jgi:hypothetical protein